MSEHETSNSPDVWDAVWASHSLSHDELAAILAAVENGPTWDRYSQLVNQFLGGWHKMSAVELGGGGSTHSLLAALKGTRSTVVDYSAEAERVVRERCRIAGIQVQFLRLDALALPAAVEAGFDLAWSFGTAEHFTGADRLAFIRAHARAVRPGGLVIISVPNRSALNYRVWMYLAQKAGEWPFGLEVPFSREELRRSLQSSGLRLVGIDAYAGRPCTAKTLGIIRRHWPLFFPIASLLVWFGKRLPSRLQQLLTQRDLVAIGLKEVTSSAATVP